MSIDKAWTYTIGAPRVKIAIIDCGIEWDEPDLINKAFLNAGELVEPNQMPQNADGLARAAARARSPATTATATASSR